MAMSKSDFVLGYHGYYKYTAEVRLPCDVQMPIAPFPELTLGGGGGGGGWSLLPEYVFFHCLPEYQVVLPGYYLLFLGPKMAI